MHPSDGCTQRSRTHTHTSLHTSHVFSAHIYAHTLLVAAHNVYAHTHTHTCSHTHAHKNIYTHTRTNTHTHAHLHTNKHAPMCALTHMHSLICPCASLRLHDFIDVIKIAYLAVVNKLGGTVAFNVISSHYRLNRLCIVFQC